MTSRLSNWWCLIVRCVYSGFNKKDLMELFALHGEPISLNWILNFLEIINQKHTYIHHINPPFTRIVVLPIFVMAGQFCQAVCPILPGSTTDFEIGIFLSLSPILCNSCLILSQRFQMKLSINLWTKKQRKIFSP